MCVFDPHTHHWNVNQVFIEGGYLEFLVSGTLD